MAKSVTLKATKGVDGDSIIGFSNDKPGALFKGDGKPVKYLCPGCARVLIRDFSLDELREKFIVPHRMVLRCTCGVDSIAFVMAPSEPPRA